MTPELTNRLRSIAEKLRQDYRAEKVILFGFYARGEGTADSDLDILIVAPTKERFFQRMATVRRLIRGLRDGFPVAPIVLTVRELEKRQKLGDPFVREILETGIPL
jgi:predicted nucleotidyltransferase